MPLSKFFRFVIVSAFATALSAASAQAAEGDKAPAKKERITKVEAAPAQMRALATTVEAVGSSRANRSVNIMTVSSGIVRSIAFTEGQQVKAGDILVKLDDTIQQADLTEAQARLKQAELALARSQSLKKRDAVATATVEQQTAAVAIAQAERDRTARYLRDRTIKAPFNGRIGFTDIEVGSHLQDDESIAVLDDLSQIKVTFFLPETLFAKVQIGTPLQADAAAFPARTFEGRIEAIDPRVNAASRSFQVRAVIDNKDNLLPAGMFMHLSLFLDQSQALSIPEEAVIVEGLETYVFAVLEQDGKLKAKRTSVRLGRRTYGWVEVLEGLSPGQSVVIRGVQKVKNGAILEVVKAAAVKG